MRVSGGDAGVMAIARAVAGVELAPRVATLATFRDAQGAPIDQGLAIAFPAPASYTGETVVEFHGHGSPAALRSLLARCVALGARVAGPGEFTKRAFLNGKLDLAQAESVADLIDAASATAARAAARSLTGAFSREVHAIVDAVTDLRMFTEATLDFPEEDVEFVRASDASRKLARVRSDVERLIARAATGARLGAGLSVVLVGRPNVGKSSLMNRLARDDVAIVTDVPGTTRDALEVELDLGGVPVTLVDTAGLRETEDLVESLGVARARAEAERADAILYVYDASAGLSASEEAELAAWTRPRVVVANKIDRALGPIAADAEPLCGLAPDAGDRLRTWLAACVASGVAIDEASEVLGSVRQRDLALRARDAAARARESLTRGESPEYAAALCGEALAALADLVGETTADDVLARVFETFCIGK